MGSDRHVSIHAGSGFWLLTAVAASAAACVTAATGHTAWAVTAFAAMCICLGNVYVSIQRLSSRIRYLLSAAINGDFSYKFRDTGISGQEKELNAMLNSLVTHLEMLGDNARQNENFLRLIINLIDSGIVIANDKGHILHANKAALAMLDLPILTDMKQIHDSTYGLSIAETSASLHGDALTIYTITDLRRPLQAAEVKSWEKMTRVLTHEIMNSLTPIHAIASSLGRQVHIDPNELKQQLGVISSSSHSLMDFVGNFRKFTALPTPKPKVIYVKPFIEKVVTLMQAHPDADTVTFDVEVFPPDAMIYTDEAMLSQVMINIVKNAVEAAPKKILIKTKIRENETVEISIANDGALIPDEVASQIFTPFFTTKPIGSGIGLSLSRRIVNQLGGSLTLALRPHTTFTIAL